MEDDAFTYITGATPLRIRKPHRPKPNSFELMILMYRLGYYFEESSHYLYPVHFLKYNHRAVLNADLIGQEQHPYHWRAKKPVQDAVYYFADIQCATGGERHQPIVSGYCVMRRVVLL